MVEAALAHTVRNPTEVAYARSDLFEHRRRLMDDWAVVWTIPAARMKAKSDHRVPLSGRALEILHDARRHSDGTGRATSGGHTGTDWSRSRSTRRNPRNVP